MENKRNDSISELDVCADAMTDSRFSARALGNTAACTVTTNTIAISEIIASGVL